MLLTYQPIGNTLYVGENAALCVTDIERHRHRACLQITVAGGVPIEVRKDNMLYVCVQEAEFGLRRNRRRKNRESRDHVKIGDSVFIVIHTVHEKMACIGIEAPENIVVWKPGEGPDQLGIVQ